MYVYNYVCRHEISGHVRPWSGPSTKNQFNIRVQTATSHHLLATHQTPRYDSKKIKSMKFHHDFDTTFVKI